MISFKRTGHNSERSTIFSVLENLSAFSELAILFLETVPGCGPV
jgi:hypothetical protein